MNETNVNQFETEEIMEPQTADVVESDEDYVYDSETDMELSTGLILAGGALLGVVGHKVYEKTLKPHVDKGVDKVKAGWHTHREKRQQKKIEKLKASGKLMDAEVTNEVEITNDQEGK